MKQVLITLIIITMSIITGCDTTENNGGMVYPVKDYYPLKINNNWEYFYKNAVENAIIEKVIKVNLKHEDGSNIWGYLEAVKVNTPETNEPISGYNTIKNGCLYFYSSDKDTMIPGTSILCKKNILLKEPVIIGTNWKINEGIKSRIDKIYELEVQGKYYPNTVLVVTDYNEGVDSSWYSLNIGLVKRIVHYGINQEYHSFQSWELRNYTID